MSINALYVYTRTAFTVSKPTVIEHLRKDPSAGSSSAGYSVVTMRVDGTFTLDPGAYRFLLGITLSPTATVAGGTTATGSAGNVAGMTAGPFTGFKISPTPAGKTGWPDPPAIAASAALNIPLAALTDFFTDAGEETELDDDEPASASPGKQANG